MNSLENHEVQNYLFLIDAHNEMIGGRRSDEKELENLGKIDQKVREEVGNIEKKTFPQKVKAIKVLFDIQIKQKVKIFKTVKRVLKLKILRDKAKRKMEKQRIVVNSVKQRFDRIDAALKKYQTQLANMTSESGKIAVGKIKLNKSFEAFVGLEINQLQEELSSAIEESKNADPEIQKLNSERASSALYAAKKFVKVTTKKHARLQKKLDSVQNTLKKLTTAHALAKQSVVAGANLVESMVINYEKLQKDIFSVTDSIKDDLTKERIMKLVPKLSADIESEAAAEAAGGYFDEFFSGGATKSRLYKYGTSVEKRLKSFDKTLKQFETDTQTRNETLLDNLGVYADILLELSNVQDLIRTYISDAERIQKVAELAQEKINTALENWRRTTEDGINNDRKKVTDNMDNQGKESSDSDNDDQEEQGQE
jgi:hypothetical protein